MSTTNTTDSDRCEATTLSSGERCTRRGSGHSNGRLVCKQHRNAFRVVPADRLLISEVILPPASPPLRLSPPTWLTRDLKDRQALWVGQRRPLGGEPSVELEGIDGPPCFRCARPTRMLDRPTVSDTELLKRSFMLRWFQCPSCGAICFPQQHRYWNARPSDRDIMQMLTPGPMSTISTEFAQHLRNVLAFRRVDFARSDRQQVLQ
jgi:hypothetical protein